MATIEEVRTAEKAMKEAQEALRAYTERQSVAPDRSLHRHLAAELSTATENYLKAIFELNSNQSNTA
ncbi:MAG: hypothetical protein WBX03_02360 [Terriglobales bacterium]|jgi:hypothetical protein